MCCQRSRGHWVPAHNKQGSISRVARDRWLCHAAMGDVERGTLQGVMAQQVLCCDVCCSFKALLCQHCPFAHAQHPRHRHCSVLSTASLLSCSQRLHTTAAAAVVVNSITHPMPLVPTAAKPCAMRAAKFLGPSSVQILGQLPSSCMTGAASSAADPTCTSTWKTSTTA